MSTKSYSCAGADPEEVAGGGAQAHLGEFYYNFIFYSRCSHNIQIVFSFDCLRDHFEGGRGPLF